MALIQDITALNQKLADQIAELDESVGKMETLRQVTRWHSTCRLMLAALDVLRDEAWFAAYEEYNEAGYAIGEFHVRP